MHDPSSDKRLAGSLVLSRLADRLPSARALLALVILCCLVVNAALALAANPKHWERVGLQYAYTYGSCTNTSVVDPINVVWYGGGPLAGGVGAVLAKHGWKYNDYQDPTLEELELLGIGGVDSQFVHDVVTSEPNGGCLRDDTQRATGNPFGNRNHIRLFGTVNRHETLFVAGDAHHDQTVFVNGCTQAIIGGHKASNYNGARDAIANIWPAHTAYHYWGNNRPIRQCDGTFTRSDGYVLYASAVVGGAAGYHPINTERPRISGTPTVGSTLTLSPGQWTGNPTAFAYQWCYINAEADTCTPIAEATSTTWTPQPSDVEKTVAVLVRPVGSKPVDAVLSNAVRITRPPSTVITGPVTPLTKNCLGEGNVLELTGEINPNGLPTTYYFEYAEKEGEGFPFKTPTESVGSGTKLVKVSSTVSVKDPALLCWEITYRLVGVNPGGTSYGETRLEYESI